MSLYQRRDAATNYNGAPGTPDCRVTVRFVALVAVVAVVALVAVVIGL